MTEQTENNEAQQEFQENMDYINEAVAKADTHALMGHIASSLYRIANAQDALFVLTQKDLSEQVEAVAEAKAQELAEEIAEDKSKRSYIGKK